MRVPNIFTTQNLSAEMEFKVDDKAAQHLVKVLRMKQGGHIRLFNNSGFFYPATLVKVGKKHVLVKTSQSEVDHCKSRLHIHLGQVMSRGDRMDFAIQKSTELGVNEITPLASERCELRLSAERRDKRIKHWQQVAISAAEQCGRASVPIIYDVMNIQQWIVENCHEGLCLVMHHQNARKLTDILPPPSAVNLLIGPEGGLSKTEIDLALHSGFIATSLGPRVMRTETAPIAGLSVLQWLWGDFQDSSPRTST